MTGARASLAVRLAAWLALLAAAVFGATGAFLYRSLEHQLLERDDMELVGKVQQLRHHMANLPSIPVLEAQTQRLLDIVVGHPGLDLEIRNERGALIAASRSAAAQVSLPAQPVPPEREPRRSDVRESAGEGRALGALAALGPAAKQRVLFIVSRSSSERLALLADYRRDLLRAVLGGALAMAILGYGLARRALRPVRLVAESAGRITAHRLGERLRVEDAPAEVAELVRAFNAMLERLDESFQRLAQFSSDMAHDLRTPIANLMSGAQIALSRPRPVREYEALLASSLEELERLQRMIDNMLFLARADNAQIAVRREALDLQMELQRIADYFEGMAEEAGIAVAASASGSLSADPTLFRRAVSNLVANAIRYTPRGATVELRATGLDDGRVAVEVANPGPAIEPAHRARIFDRFYRADSARSESHSSSGLGLAIVKSVMTLHGGNVEVESTPGERTVFRLIFPPGRDTLVVPARKTEIPVAKQTS